MATVHFTLGEDLGIQLAEISKEHILDYDLHKAVSLWIESFGCPEDMAEELTAGKLVVVVDDPEQCLINVTERESLSKKREKQYPQITKEEIYRLIDKNFQSPRDYDEETATSSSRPWKKATGTSQRLTRKHLPLRRPPWCSVR